MKKAVESYRWSAMLPWMVCILAWTHPFILGAAHVHAAESVCAEVKLEIKQELTLERQAFDAHMRINNGLSHISLEDVSISVQFTDADGNVVQASADPSVASASFFIRVDSMTNIGDVNGSGTVAPSTSADIHWLIIPAPGASNGLESGALYYVGATLSYTLGGEANETEVSTDYIYVKPMPEITLDYFLPLEVYGDDAFTDVIEAPVPFSLGVRVKNSGHGTARELKIESAQPRITENEQGLLIGFSIEGSQVNGVKATESLLADFGDIAPGTSGTARWIMTCTLSGRFVKFDADFSHSDELGGELTSLIDTVETHFLVRDVQVDIAARDQIRDFLAKDGDIYRVYESESVDTPVSDQSAASTLQYKGTQGERIAYTLTTPVTDGFVYVRLPDPHGGRKAIHSAIRGDGKQIKTDNVWLSKSRDGQSWKYFINLFDAASTGSYSLTVADPAAVPQAPVLQYIENVMAVEGQRISFIVQASDPDGTIPSLSVATRPVGAVFSDEGDGMGIFDWTPEIGQAGTYSITFNTSDGGLADTQLVNFTIRSVDDTDGDGMNDAWEMAQFGTLDRNGNGDFDSDGISDLDEYLAGSDPTAEDHAPTVPVILSPVRDESVATLTPELVIENSTDADGEVIVYEFEVYADSQSTQLVAVDREVAETTDTTSWTLPAELVENQHYFWRVRATDGYSYSLWTYGNFFVNKINDPPNQPVVSFPPDDTYVDTLTPLLEVTGATDPDEEVLTCSFVVYADMAMASPLADVHGLVIPEDGVVRWNVDASLVNDTSYFWRALVVDAQGQGAQTALTMFTVNTANHAPTMPVISLPANGDEISATAVELVVTNAVDADGDAVGYYFEIDTAPSFNGAEKQASVMIGEGTDTTAWPVFDLEDNTIYYWRTMATDTAAPSQWTVGRFFVNTANDRPDALALKNPGQDAWVGVLTPELSLADGVDSDKDSLAYRYEIYTEPTLENLVAWGETLSTRWTVVTDLTGKTRYYWRTRATDEHGIDGNWMPTASFFVREEEPLPPDAIEVRVSTDNGRLLEGIKAYAFNASGSYTGNYATTGSEGRAIFDIDTLAPAVYQFRANYLGSQFWSDAVSISETAVIPIVIAEETVALTIETPSAVVTGARVYLFSGSGAYLGRYLLTDANGQVFFDLPAGETFLFRADILGSQYWSSATTVLAGAINTVSVDAGGGLLQVVVRQDETTPMPGIRVYLFSDTGKYLGVSGTTDETGTVGFNVTGADYKLRADYLGYRFWSETIHVATDTTEIIEIDHQPARLTVQGRFQDVEKPFDGIKSYLFSAGSAYLGQNLTTDESGQALFNLPEKEFKLRADVLGGQYWSEPFTWEDPVVTIPLADAQVTVTGAGLPKDGVPVYVFTKAGTYLGLNDTTDQTGRVTFRLPEGEYDFRADYQGSQFWVQDRMLVADVVNDVDISVGGGTFELSVKSDADAPLAGVKCYVFNENDAYLGLSGSTDETGIVGFDLADGVYRFRADYFGHQFWSDPIDVAGNTAHAMVIANSPIRVRALAAEAAVPGARIHLFSASETYLGHYATTDDQGEVVFDLPTGITFQFRADILGGQYWSGDVIVSEDASPVVIDAGGGRLQVTVQTDTGSPFADLKVYLFAESGNYLGLSETTAADGGVAFDVPQGTYHIRTDYKGYSFWQEDIQVVGDTKISLIIALQPVATTVVGGYQSLDTAIEGIRVNLFTPTGTYLGLSGITDEQGRVTFDLPEKSYMVRADTIAGQYWSDPFTWQDATLRIPIAEVAVTVTGAGLPAAGVNVYLFSTDDAYLGQNLPTDDQGTVRFSLPAQSYKFRADYQSKHYWSGDIALEADMENPVLISVGGGNVSLTLEKGGGVPMAGIDCYAFTGSGAYLGLKGATSDNGRVSFELADGSIQFRADYLGYQYWTNPFSIPDTQAQTMVIDHTDVTVTFQGSYLGDIEPLDGRQVFLFSPSGAYLGQNQSTDAQGRAVFSLPDQLYQARCDELGANYWSDDFQSIDTTVTVHQGKAVVHATFLGEPAENARVYLFSNADRYLGRYENTDSNGNVQLILPQGQYRFRVDLDGRQQWTDITEITADLETVIDVVME